ncbi:hypothetical protein K449DRAFT_11883 [Hypoxylon sp. EC38]|nr:hypothetical protein K449DRAFT_11883 [Hypoxylon sp. EC38]
MRLCLLFPLLLFPFSFTSTLCYSPRRTLSWMRRFSTAVLLITLSFCFISHHIIPYSFGLSGAGLDRYLDAVDSRLFASFISLFIGWMSASYFPL